MRQLFLQCLLIAACVLTGPARAAAPSITQQPLDRLVMENQPVTFFVGVTGDAPLDFTWYRNGTILSNAPNAPAYSIPFVSLADSGAGYSVLITNSFGSVTSEVATLTVSLDAMPPTILLVTNAPDFIHITVVFSERVSEATAADVINYTLPGVNLIGAALDPSGSNVTLTADSELTDGVTYSLNVADVTDVAAFPNTIAPGTQYNFRAGRPPVIGIQPASLMVNPGDPAALSVTASGSSLVFQWYKGLQLLAGQSNALLDLSPATPASLGSYRVVVSNYLGSVTSAPATLSFFGNYTVNLPVGLTFVAKQLSNSNPEFPPAPDGTLLYKWNSAAGNFDTYSYVDGFGWFPGPLAVAVGEGVIIDSPIPASLVFTGTRIAPVLPVQLQPGLNLLGAQEPKPAGYNDLVGPPQEGALVYQYKPGGDATVFSDDNYRLNYFIKGVWRDQPPRLKVGEAAWVRIGTPVVITNQPVAQTNITIGASASFTVGATGETPIRFQWRLNGQDIPGATNDLYFIDQVAPSNAGIYSVTVGNVLGDIDSLNVPLRLDVPEFALADDFSAQAVVNDFSRLLSSHNRDATTEPGEPQHGGKRTRSSVWLSWQAPTGGILNVSLSGSGFDSVLAVYTGNNVSNLYQLDADDDAAGYGCARVRFNARAGNTYRICVSGLGDNQGDVLLGWNLEPTAQFLPEFGTQPHDLTVGYGQTAEFSAGVTNGNVSYQWFHNGQPVSNNPSALTSTLVITNVNDSHVGVYFALAINQNRQRASARVELQIQVPSPAGPTEGLLSVDKLFDLDLAGGGGGQPFKQPEQKFGVVHHGYSVANPGMSVSAYARAYGEPNHCGIAGGSTVWFTVQAETNGTLYVNTDTSTYNTLLAGYIGPGDSYATLTNVGCDNNSGLDGLDSRMSFPVVTGKQYFIAAGGVGASTGTLRWKFQLVRPITITNLVYTNLSGGRVTMRIDGTPGLAATVQRATNLNAPAWVTLTNYTPPNSFFNFTNNNLGTTNWFYRVLNSF